MEALSVLLGEAGPHLVLAEVPSTSSDALDPVIDVDQYGNTG